MPFAVRFLDSLCFNSSLVTEFMRSAFEYDDSLNVVENCSYHSELMDDDAEQVCANSCTHSGFHSVTWTLTRKKLYSETVD